MKRGALSTSVAIVRHPGGGGFSISAGLKKADLNYFCLYWDELVIPSNNIVNAHVEGESEFIKSGFLKRPEMRVEYSQSDINYEFITELDKKSLKEVKDENKSTHWFVNEIGMVGSDGDRGSNNIVSPALIIELMRALPVPLPTVHCNDILAFKLRRRDELDAIHELVNELYVEVKTSANPDLAMASAFHRLESAINDLNKSFTHRWRKSLRYDISFNKDLSAGDIYSAVMGAQAVSLAVQNQIVPALIQGAVAALPNVLSRISFSPVKGKNADNNRLKYLSHASNAGVVSI